MINEAKLAMISNKSKILIFLAVIVMIFTSFIMLWRISGPAPVVYEGITPISVITGPPDNQLKQPVAVAVGLRGQLFVVDAGNKRIVVIEEDGRYSMSFGGPGSGMAELAKPVSIDISLNGNIYVADQEKKGVLVFNSDGEYLYTITGDKEKGFAPYSLKTDGKGNLWVYDLVRRKFLVFDSEGKQTDEFPSESEIKLDKFTAFDIEPEDETVYGINQGKAQFYKLSGKELVALGETRLGNPGGIKVNRSKQQVMVSDTFNNKIVVFDKEGNYLGEFGGLGDAMDQLKSPAGVAFDERGRLYVADKGNNRVVIYSY